MDTQVELQKEFELGLQYLEGKNFVQAKRIFHNLLQQQYQFNVLNCYAISAFNLQEYDEALKAINFAISSNPEISDGYKNKIAMLEKLSRFEEMLACANELELVENSNSSSVALLKGNIYQKLNKNFLAVKEYQRHLVSIYPEKIVDNEIGQLSGQDTLYHINFLQKKSTPYVDYPQHVAFETYAQCNAKCTFCVYPDMQRIGTLMSMTLIDKIIEDLKQIPSHIPFQLSPFGVNEPFLDKRFFEILEKITNQLPNANITITSNATPLNQINLDKLCGFKLDYLWLSVVDHRKEVYEEKMKLNYELMLKNLDLIHKALIAGRLKTRVVASRLMESSETDRAFVEFINKRFPVFETCLWPYTNWIGRTSNHVTEQVANIPCSHWYEFRINADGIVQHCCMDGHAEFPWGDVSKQTVLEIYNSGPYRKLRLDTFSRKSIKPCDTCTLR